MHVIVLSVVVLAVVHAVNSRPHMIETNKTFQIIRREYYRDYPNGEQQREYLSSFGGRGDLRGPQNKKSEWISSRSGIDPVNDFDSKPTTKVKRMNDGTLKILYGAREEPDIVFPGPNSGDSFTLPKFDSTVGLCGGKTTFCETTDNYPASWITNLLQNSVNEFRDLQGVDELTEVAVGERIDTGNNISLCKSEETLVFPKAAQNKEERWLFIVNQPNYEQGVRIEKCKEDGVECEFSSSFPNGYKTFCQQKYIYRKMLAINNEAGEPYTDYFRLPSCCSCTVVEVGNPLSGFLDNKKSPVRKRSTRARNTNLKNY